MAAGAEQIRTIIVVGASGSGKSEIIKQLGGQDDKFRNPPETSAGFLSCTQKASTYDAGVFGGARYQLVDTMGMLDTNRKDKEGLESIARLLDQLSTVVGVIYVVTGRMNPPEMEICNFLFDEFFHDLDPKRLLVLRTKVNNWESYNAESDKDDLKLQGGVPKRILDANFVAVDFHPDKTQASLKKMTKKILEHARSWTTNVKLSEKTGIALKYHTSQKRLMQRKGEIQTIYTLLGSGMGGAAVGIATAAGVAAEGLAGVAAGSAAGVAAGGALATGLSVVLAGAAAGAVPALLIAGAVMIGKEYCSSKDAKKK